MFQRTISNSAVSPAMISSSVAIFAMFRSGHSTVTESLGVSSGWFVAVMLASLG